MTVLIVLAVLLILAIAGPLFGTDTRSSRGWAATDPNQPLWDGSGVRAAR